MNITPKNYRNWYLISGSYKSLRPSVTFILFTLFSMEIDFVFIIGVKLSQNKELAENAKRASLC